MLNRNSDSQHLQTLQIHNDDTDNFPSDGGSDEDDLNPVGPLKIVGREADPLDIEAWDDDFELEKQANHDISRPASIDVRVDEDISLHNNTAKGKDKDKDKDDVDDFFDDDDDMAEFEALNTHLHTQPKFKLDDSSDHSESENWDDEPADADGDESEDWDAEIEAEEQATSPTNASGSMMSEAQQAQRAKVKKLIEGFDDDEGSDDDEKREKPSVTPSTGGGSKKTKKQRGVIKPEQTLLSALNQEDPSQHRVDIVMYPAPPALYSIRVDGSRMNEKQVDQWLTDLTKKNIPFQSYADQYAHLPPWDAPETASSLQLSMYHYMCYTYQHAFLAYKTGAYQVTWDRVTELFSYIDRHLTDYRVQKVYNDPQAWYVANNLMFLLSKLWSENVKMTFFNIILCVKKLFPAYSQLIDLLERETIAHHAGKFANQIIRDFCSIYLFVASGADKYNPSINTHAGSFDANNSLGLTVPVDAGAIAVEAALRALTGLHLYLSFLSPLNASTLSSQAEWEEDKEEFQWLEWALNSESPPTQSPDPNYDCSRERLVWKLCGPAEYRLNLIKDLYSKAAPLSWTKAMAALTMGRHEWFVDDDKAPEEHVMLSERLLMECMFILDNLPPVPPNKLDLDNNRYNLSVQSMPLLGQLSLTALQLFADVMFALNKYKYAIRALESALENHQLRYGDCPALIRRLSDICAIHNDIPRCVMYHLKILNQSITDGNLDTFVFVTQEISKLYVKQGNYRRAEEHLRASIAFLLTLCSPSSQALAQAYIEVRHEHGLKPFEPKLEGQEAQQQLLLRRQVHDNSNKQSRSRMGYTHTHNMPAQHVHRMTEEAKSPHNGSKTASLVFLGATSDSPLARLLSVPIAEIQASVANLIIMLARVYLNGNRLVHALILLEALRPRDHEMRMGNNNNTLLPFASQHVNASLVTAAKTSIYMQSCTNPSSSLPNGYQTSAPSPGQPTFTAGAGSLSALLSNNSVGTLTTVVAPWVVLFNVGASLPKAKLSLIDMLLAQVYMKLGLLVKADRLLKSMEQVGGKSQFDGVPTAQKAAERERYAEFRANSQPGDGLSNSIGARDVVYTPEYMEARAKQAQLCGDYKQALVWISRALSSCEASSLHLLGRFHYRKGLVYKAVVVDQMNRGPKEAVRRTITQTLSKVGSNGYDTLSFSVAIDSGHISATEPGFHIIGNDSNLVLLPDPRLCANAFTKSYGYFEKLDDRVHMAQCLRNMVEMYLHVAFVPLALLGHSCKSFLPWLRIAGFAHDAQDTDADAAKALKVFLSVLESSANNALATAAAAFLPLLLLHCQLNLAEIRVLQGNIGGALSFWSEAKCSFTAAFMIADEVVLPVKPSLDLVHEYKAILSRLVRLLFAFDPAVLNANLFLLDAYIHLDTNDFASSASQHVQEMVDVLRTDIEESAAGNGNSTNYLNRPTAEQTVLFGPALSQLTNMASSGPAALSPMSLLMLSQEEAMMALAQDAPMSKPKAVMQPPPVHTIPAPLPLTPSSLHMDLPTPRRSNYNTLGSEKSADKSFAKTVGGNKHHTMPAQSKTTTNPLNATRTAIPTIRTIPAQGRCGPNLALDLNDAISQLEETGGCGGQLNAGNNSMADNIEGSRVESELHTISLNLLDHASKLEQHVHAAIVTNNQVQLATTVANHNVTLSLVGSAASVLSLSSPFAKSTPSKSHSSSGGHVNATMPPPPPAPFQQQQPQSQSQSQSHASVRSYRQAANMMLRNIPASAPANAPPANPHAHTHTHAPVVSSSSSTVSTSSSQLRAQLEGKGFFTVTPVSNESQTISTTSVAIVNKSLAPALAEQGRRSTHSSGWLGGLHGKVESHDQPNYNYSKEKEKDRDKVKAFNGDSRIQGKAALLGSRVAFILGEMDRRAEQAGSGQLSVQTLGRLNRETFHNVVIAMNRLRHLALTSVPSSSIPGLGLCACTCGTATCTSECITSERIAHTCWGGAVSSVANCPTCAVSLASNNNNALPHNNSSNNSSTIALFNVFGSVSLPIDQAICHSAQQQHSKLPPACAPSPSHPSASTLRWGNPARVRAHSSSLAYMIPLGPLFCVFLPKTCRKLVLSYANDHVELDSTVVPNSVHPSSAFVRSVVHKIYAPERTVVVSAMSREQHQPSPVSALLEVGSLFDNVGSVLQNAAYSYVPPQLDYRAQQHNQTLVTKPAIPYQLTTTNTVFTPARNATTPNVPTTPPTTSASVCWECSMSPCLCNITTCGPLLTAVSVDMCTTEEGDTLNSSLDMSNNKRSVCQLGHAQILQINMPRMLHMAVDFYRNTTTQFPSCLPPPPSLAADCEPPKAMPTVLSVDGKTVLELPVASSDDTPTTHIPDTDPALHSIAYKVRFFAPPVSSSFEKNLMEPLVANHLFGYMAAPGLASTEDYCKCTACGCHANHGNHDECVGSAASVPAPTTTSTTAVSVTDTPPASRRVLPRTLPPPMPFTQQQAPPPPPHSCVSPQCTCAPLKAPSVRVPVLGSTLHTQLPNFKRIAVADSEALLPPALDHSSVEELVALTDPIVCSLMAAILCESRILLVSHSTYRLKAIMNTVMALIYPFQWQHLCIPLLHRACGHDILAHKRPYLIGVQTATLESVMKAKTQSESPDTNGANTNKNDNKRTNTPLQSQMGVGNHSTITNMVSSLNLGDVVVCDIDNGVFRYEPGTLVTLPEKIRKEFQNGLKIFRTKQLRSALVKADNTNNEQFGLVNDKPSTTAVLSKLPASILGTSAFPTPADPAKPDDFHLTQLRNHFLKAMLVLFYRYALFWDASASSLPSSKDLHGAMHAQLRYRSSTGTNDGIISTTQSSDAATTTTTTTTTTTHLGTTTTTMTTTMNTSTTGLRSPYPTILPQPTVTIHSPPDWFRNLDYDLPGFLAHTKPQYRPFVQAVTNTALFRHFLAVRHRLKGMPVCMYLFDQWAAIRIHNKWTRKLAVWREKDVSEVISVARVNGRFHKRLLEFHGPRVHVYFDTSRNSSHPMPKHDRLLVPLLVHVVVSPHSKNSTSFFPFKVVAFPNETAITIVNQQLHKPVVPASLMRPDQVEEEITHKNDENILKCPEAAYDSAYIKDITTNNTGVRSKHVQEQREAHRKQFESSVKTLPWPLSVGLMNDTLIQQWQRSFIFKAESHEQRKKLVEVLEARLMDPEIIKRYQQFM